MTGFLQAWSVRWQAPASSARAGAGAAAASRDGTGRPASAAAARLLTDYPPVGRILPLAGLLVLVIGFWPHSAATLLSDGAKPTSLKASSRSLGRQMSRWAATQRRFPFPPSSPCPRPAAAPL